MVPANQNGAVLTLTGGAAVIHGTQAVVLASRNGAVLTLTGGRNASSSSI